MRRWCYLQKVWEAVGYAVEAVGAVVVLAVGAVLLILGMILGGHNDADDQD